MCLASISDLSPGTNAPTLSCIWKLLDPLDREIGYLSDGCWAGRGQCGSQDGTGGRDNHRFLVLGRMLRSPHCHPPPQCLLNGPIPHSPAAALSLMLESVGCEKSEHKMNFCGTDSDSDLWSQPDLGMSLITTLWPLADFLCFLICEVELIIAPFPKDCCDVIHSA